MWVLALFLFMGFSWLIVWGILTAMKPASFDDIHGIATIGETFNVWWKVILIIVVISVVAV